jgi:hypothetical protein
LVEGGVVEDQFALAAFGAGFQLDAEAELAGEGFFEVLDVGGGAGFGLGWWGGSTPLLHQAFEVADGEALGEDEVGEALLLHGVGQTREELGVADGELAVTDEDSDGLGEV